VRDGLHTRTQGNVIFDYMVGVVTSRVFDSSEPFSLNEIKKYIVEILSHPLLLDTRMTNKREKKNAKTHNNII